MKKRFSLLFVFLIPALLSAQAIHQWKGHGTIDGISFEVKVALLENNHFIGLVQTEEAPFAVEGTWESEDDHLFKLTLTTETIMGEDVIPFREGRVHIIDEHTAAILANGLGLELTRHNPTKAPE